MQVGNTDCEKPFKPVSIDTCLGCTRTDVGIPARGRGEGRRGSILINWNKPVEKYLCVIFGTGILSNANLSRARKTGLYGWKVKRKWERELSTAMTTELFKVRRTQATNIKTLKIINSCNLFSSKTFCFVITSHAMQLQFSYAYSLFVLRENNFLSISLLIFKKVIQQLYCLCL